VFVCAEEQKPPTTTHCVPQCHSVTFGPICAELKRVMLSCKVLLLGSLACALAGVCTGDADCSLNGVCVQQSCVCDPGWGGPGCTALQLAPAEPDSGVIAWPTSTWGGIAVADPNATDLYHFFYSRFVGGCGLACWVNSSECVRAEGPTPTGPFVDKAVVLGVFCHNPTVRLAPDGTYLLWHIGKPDPSRAHACSSSSETCASNYPPSLPTDGRELITYSSAPHPAGPWTPRGSAAFAGTGAGWLGWVSNPSVHFFPNGSALLAFRAKVMPGGGGEGGSPLHAPVGEEVIGLATAPHWSGPYTLAVAHPIAVEHEDPHVWADRRGNLHLLSHGATNHWFTTPDQLGVWTLASAPAYGFGFEWANGTAATALRRERPQLVFSTDGNMTPLAFTTGVTIKGGPAQMSLTLAQRVIA